MSGQDPSANCNIMVKVLAKKPAAAVKSLSKKPAAKSLATSSATCLATEQRVVKTPYKRQLKREGTDTSVASSSHVNAFGTSKHDAAFIQCKRCDAKYLPDRGIGFRCMCGSPKFNDHFGDPHTDSD